MDNASQNSHNGSSDNFLSLSAPDNFFSNNFQKSNGKLRAYQSVHFLKLGAYDTKPDTRRTADVERRIVNCYATITPDILQKAQQEWERRLDTYPVHYRARLWHIAPANEYVRLIVKVPYFFIT